MALKKKKRKKVVLAAGQDRVGDGPLDLLRVCGVLQVLGEGGEALAPT